MNELYACSYEPHRVLLLPLTFEVNGEMWCLQEKNMKIDPLFKTLTYEPG